jgi:hypothetical protein
MEIALNDKQLIVLRWIRDRCPEGVMHDETYKISAAALRTRDLIRTTGRGDRWRAEITDRGRAYLDSRPVGSPQRRSRGEERAQPLWKTDRLVAEVIDAGGCLTLQDETSKGGVDWRQRAYAAQRHGKVPEGARLTVRRKDGTFVISLEDGATGNELGLDELHVPSRITRYHPVARAFRERTALHEVSRKALPRASRVVHALAAELERRGHKVECGPPPDQSGGRDYKHNGHVLVMIHGHPNLVRVWEKGVGLRGVWERQRDRWEQDRLSPGLGLYLSRPEPYDARGKGELNLSVLGYSSRQTTWGDRKRWRAETRLPQLLRELEAQAREAEERRLRREREEAERQREWDAALAQARRQLMADHKRAVLRQRVEEWQEGEAIRAYCVSVEREHADAVAGDSQAREWLAFARAQADRLQSPPEMPPEPEPTADALEPYLGGLRRPRHLYQ